MRTSFWAVVCLWVSLNSFGANQIRGLVKNTSADNRALLIAAANGLSGLDYDIDNLKEIGENKAYGFKDMTLWDGKASLANSKKELTALAREVGEKGTLLFYFTGHGMKGSLYMGDQKLMKAADIRGAIEAGRQGIGPVERLVLIYDSCYSGSLVDPIDGRARATLEKQRAQEMVNEIVAEFSTRDSRDYWKSLFVFASSGDNETSLASPKGSIFTLALKKAFDEIANKNGTLANLVELTKKYTEGHHPVERFVPATMANESLL